MPKKLKTLSPSSIALFTEEIVRKAQLKESEKTIYVLCTDNYCKIFDVDQDYAGGSNIKNIEYNGRKTYGVPNEWKIYKEQKNDKLLILTPPMKDIIPSAKDNMANVTNSALPLEWMLKFIVKDRKEIAGANNSKINQLYIVIPLNLINNNRNHWVELLVHVDFKKNLAEIVLKDSQPWIVAKGYHGYKYSHIEQALASALQNEAPAFDVKFYAEHKADQWNSYDCGRWTEKYIEDDVKKINKSFNNNRNPQIIPSFFARNKGKIAAITVGVVLAVAFIAVLILSHGAAAAAIPFLAKVAVGTAVAAGIKVAFGAAAGFCTGVLTGAFSKLRKIFKPKPKKFKEIDQYLETKKSGGTHGKLLQQGIGERKSSNTNLKILIEEEVESITDTDKAAENSNNSTEEKKDSAFTDINDTKLGQDWQM